MGPQKREILAAVVCLLVSTFAFADITSVTPAQLNVGSVEEFITIRGTGLNGSVSTSVVFTGPAGTITIAPNNAAEDGGFPVDLGLLIVYVPGEVAVTPGHYTIDVYATYGTGVVHSGPASFDVVALEIDAPPLLFVPEVVYAEATTRGATFVAYEATAISLDGVTTYPVSCSPPSGSAFPLGTTTVNCSASNSFGDASASFQVVVGDSIPPDVTVPANIVSDGAVVTWTATATDNLDGPLDVSCTPASGSTFATGTTLVTCSAQDSHANRGYSFFTVTVSQGLPVLHLPEPVFVASTGGSVIVNYTVTATNGTVSCSPPSGSLFAPGTTTVNCTATNAVGTVSGSFEATVYIGPSDTTPPVLTVTNVTAEATGPTGAVVTFAPTAVDDVSGPLPVVCTPPSGSLFALGLTTVNCSATDEEGNIGTASFTVNVVDTTPPVLTVADVSAEATSAAGAVVTFAPTATDIVSGSVAVLCTPASGSTFAPGATTVVCSATDAANNTGTASFTVTVVDTTPPEVTEITATPASLWPPNHKMVNVVVSVTATDLTDPAPVSQIVGVSSDQPINGTGDGDTAPDWNVTGPLTLELRSERSSGKDRTYTITVATTDLFGNFTLSTVQVKVTQQSSSKKRAVSP